MGYHLHGAAEKIAAALAGDETLVNRSLGEVALPRQALVDEALVVPEIEVALVTVVGHEYFAMLERRHRSGIDVEIRIHLLHGHFVTACFQKMPEGSGGDALPQRRNDAAGHEYVLGHDPPPNDSQRTDAVSIGFKQRAKRIPAKNAPANIRQCFQTLFHSTRRHEHRPHPHDDFTHWKHAHANSKRNRPAADRPSTDAESAPERPLFERITRFGRRSHPIRRFRPRAFPPYRIGKANALRRRSKQGGSL